MTDPDVCPRCGKVPYLTRVQAKRAARSRAFGKDRMNAYRCGPVWHIGHTDKVARGRARWQRAQGRRVAVR